MKKIFAILLAVTLLASMATVVSAAESTTTLSTTVPAASYTLNIPADQTIEFGATETNIGNVTVTNSAGFAEGKNLSVTVTYDEFTSAGLSTTIPFSLEMSAPSSYGTTERPLASGSSMIFKGTAAGTVKEKTTIRVTVGNMGAQSDEPITGILLNIDSADWGKALGGEYLHLSIEQNRIERNEEQENRHARKG